MIMSSEHPPVGLRQQAHQVRQRWSTLTLYERFEQTVLYILTALIAILVAVATLRLALTVFVLLRANLVDPSDYGVFQAVFGMMFTVLIALEFKHSLLVVLHGQVGIVQVRSVILIALLALVRKFILVDVHTMTPGMLAALAGAVLALGLVYWFVRDQDRRRALGVSAPQPWSERELDPHK